MSESNSPEPTCKNCGKEFETHRQLHAHLKAHDLRVVEYYQKYFPRYDFHDKKIIRYKTLEQYFSTDFNSRSNLRLWLKSVSEEESRDYCKNILLKRKNEKGLIYTPTQVELRTILSPPIQYLRNILDGYYKVCEELGFKNKYQLPTEMIEGKEYEKSQYSIHVDTREQMPLKFNDYRTKPMALSVGDYTFSEPKLTCNCYVERKSLADFISTMSVKNLDRFEKEIIRAKEENINLIILVEDTLSHAVSFKFLPHISKKIKATPEYIFHNVRHLIQKYPHIQFLFVGGRKEAERVIKKIFFSGCSYVEVDLQYSYDTKVL
ncbi:MAG: hypothetical protein CMI54_00255 [Parcubacteria group bacterium]|nr:hypothetical protein [Parcubacteria group bacterium]|tara:strand:- start:28021 stop:28980 length:960 start_codon:yes stop_codon:yes gene_type:complete